MAHTNTNTEYFREAIGQAWADGLETDLLFCAVLNTETGKAFSQAIDAAIWADERLFDLWLAHGHEY